MFLDFDFLFSLLFQKREIKEIDGIITNEHKLIAK